MNIIDVTLRDGGHIVKFDWPLDLAKRYYQRVSEIPDVTLVELGYWGQSSKSTNMFYNLDLQKVREITQNSKRGNVSVMVDYHYCSKDFNTYPNDLQQEVAMIRVCSRKKDIDEALEFLDQLKQRTGLQVSFNVFNVSNYSHEELKKVCEKVSMHDVDYVYFADTHGCIDMQTHSPIFKDCISILNKEGINVGMHLHDHSGKAFYNYKMLEEIGFSSTDASTRGMGKGVGNLKLEHIVSKKYLCPVLEIIKDYEDILTMRESPYGAITSKYSITDYYGYNAERLGISIGDFDTLCSKISGIDMDVYNASVLS